MKLFTKLRDKYFDRDKGPGPADTARWVATAARKKKSYWDDRNLMMSRFVRQGDVVYDFGAGARKLREMLPESCTYCPIDCVASDPSVFVVDYNLGFALPALPPTCLYMAGFLEYIDDLPEFFAQLRRSVPGTFSVFSYTFEISDLIRRKSAGWRNYLGDLAATESFFASHFSNLRQADMFGTEGTRQVIFVGELRGTESLS